MRIPAAGGTPQAITRVDASKGESMHHSPRFLPGGQSILFTVGMGQSLDSSRTAVLDLTSRAYRLVGNPGYSGRYVSTGHLVYQRGDSLYAVPFDLKHLAVTGAETQVVEGVAPREYTFSDTSLLVFRTSAGTE